MKEDGRLGNGPQALRCASRGEGQSFAAASLGCCAALGTTMIASSRELGWTSMLVDHDRIVRSSEEFETRPTPDQTIVVMLRGEQHIEVRKRGEWRSASYGKGTVGMTAAGQADRLRRRIGGRGPLPEKAVLYIPPRFFAETIDFYRQAGQGTRNGPLTVLAFNDPAIAGTALALLQAMKADAPDFYAEAAARWLATHLLAAHAGWNSIAEDPRHPGVIRDRRLQRVLALIEDNPSHSLTLADLAAEAGVSKFHFTRLFRQATGKTPLAYLLEHRLAAACTLLGTTDQSIDAVAASCGFTRATHFATAFGRKFGETPSAYRRRRA